jgi:diacylglycerol kinase (ATP)
LIDVGNISFKSTNRYFLNVADIGFGAKVIETMDRQRKKGMGGKTSYSVAILRMFFSYKKQVIGAKGDGVDFKGKSLMLVISNGTSFGHGLKVFPDAKIHSGKLGLVLIETSLYMNNLKNLKKGRKISHLEVHYIFKRLEFNASEIIHAETDGEIAGTASIAVEEIPRALFLIC